jgi:hypothetical protein
MTDTLDRARREYEFCRAIADAKAAGLTPPTEPQPGWVYAWYRTLAIQRLILDDEKMHRK